MYAERVHRLIAFLLEPVSLPSKRSGHKAIPKLMIDINTETLRLGSQPNLAMPRRVQRRRIPGTKAPGQVALWPELGGSRNYQSLEAERSVTNTILGFRIIIMV